MEDHGFFSSGDFIQQHYIQKCSVVSWQGGLLVNSGDIFGAEYGTRWGVHLVCWT